jgi:hypothetical protein
MANDIKWHVGQGFWKITLGNILAGVFSIAVVIYEAGQINERFTQKIDGLIEWKKTIDDKISHEDEVGTKALQSYIVREADSQSEQNRRIQNMEGQLDHVIPDVREVKTKIDFIANYLEDGNAAHKKP